jgi:hypothetical protein
VGYSSTMKRIHHIAVLEIIFLQYHIYCSFSMIGVVPRVLMHHEIKLMIHAPLSQPSQTSAAGLQTSQPPTDSHDLPVTPNCANLITTQHVQATAWKTHTSAQQHSPILSRTAPSSSTDPTSPDIVPRARARLFLDGDPRPRSPL